MSNENLETTHTELHSWPHIPSIQWEPVIWFISNTTITTILFLFLVIVFSYFWNKALKQSKSSRLKLFILTSIKFFDKYLVESFWNKEFSRRYFPLVVWMFFIILFWNLLWLMIDWLWSSISPTILSYLRPMHSDLNTTLVLWAITVFMFLFIWVKHNWWLKYSKWYLFNWKWDSFFEKCINVFVWWLHLIWIPSTLASLSLRLFWNIFAWVILIWVITYLWALMSRHVFEAWRLLSVPFWFFEFFVAFIQAIVFAWLMISYFKQASEESH